VQLMLRFKQTARPSASEVLKSLYFAENSAAADCGDEATNNNDDSSLSSLSSSSASETDHNSDREFNDHEEV